jgi:hypothetical protein
MVISVGKMAVTHAEQIGIETLTLDHVSTRTLQMPEYLSGVALGCGVDDLGFESR